MNKLSKEQLARKAEHVRLLDEGRKKFQAVLDEQNKVLAEVRAAVDAARDEYNELVAATNEFIVEVYGAQEEYFDSKSEKWQEGDAGSVYGEWMNAWAGELDELSIDGPEDMELDERDNDSLPLDEYPDSVEGSK